MKHSMHLDHLADRLLRKLHDTNAATGSDTYTPKLYKPAESIVRTHLLPRLGFPKNIGVLWEGNDDQIETYIIGICIGSIFIVGVMAVCLFIITILKILGYKRVGFWSGRFEYDGEEEEDDDDAITKDENSTRNGNGGDYVDNVEEEEDYGIKKNENSSRNDVGITENENSTAIIAVRTIGSGEFKDRSSHVSIDIEEAVVDPELPEAASVDEVKNRIGDDPDGTVPVDEVRQRIDDDTDDAIIASKPKPALKRFRLNVARTDPDGKIVALRPKPVPENLYLKVNAVRLVFIFCGVGAIVSAGLFYGLGVKKFKQSLHSTRTGLTHFNALALKSINVTDNLLNVQQKVENQLNTTEKALDTITSSCDLGSFVNATNLLQHYGIVKNHFITISNTTRHLLNGFGDNMRNIVEATTTAHDQTYMAKTIFAFLVLIMCIMIITIFIMIIGVAFAAYEIENCFTCFMRRVILLPIFVLQVILATLFSALFFVGALTGSDFCISPDHHAKRMFARVAGGADDSLSPLFTLVLFYLSGCREINDVEGAESIQDKIDGVDSVLVLAHDMFDIFNTLTPQDILTYCDVNIGLIQHFDELGVAMHNITHQLHDSLGETLDIVSCRSVILRTFAQP